MDNQEGVVDKHSQRLPQSYYLDESDQDSVILPRSDGSFVAAFSAQSPTKEAIRQGATEDYPRLLAQALATQRRYAAPQRAGRARGNCASEGGGCLTSRRGTHSRDPQMMTRSRR